MAEYKSSVIKYGAVALILGILVIGLSAYSSGVVTQHLIGQQTSKSTPITSSPPSTNSLSSGTTTSPTSSGSTTTSNTNGQQTPTSSSTKTTVTTATYTSTASTTVTVTTSQSETSQTTTSSTISSTGSSSSPSFTAQSATTSSTSSFTSNSTTVSSSSLEMNVLATLPIQTGSSSSSSSSSRAFDPYNKVIYVSTANDSIAAMNATTNELIVNMTFNCGNPSSLVFDSRNRVLYSLFENNDPVSCQVTKGTLVGINTTSGKIISTTSGFGSFSGMAFDSKDNLLVIEGSNESSLVPSLLLLSATSQEQVGTIGLPIYPGGPPPGNVFFGPILYDQNNSLVYFVWGIAGANNLGYGGSIANITSRSIVGVFDPKSSDMPPSQLTDNPGNGLVYVAQSGSGGCDGVNSCTYLGGGNVTILSGNETLGNYVVNRDVNSTLGSTAYDNASNRLFVTNSTSPSFFFGSSNSSSFHNVTIIDTKTGKLAGVLNFPDQAVTGLYVDPAEPSGTTWLYVTTASSLYVVNVGS